MRFLYRVEQLTIIKPNPDKQDKCVNEVVFCLKIAENNF